MLELYGHPFSSYTWKVLIALYANHTPFTFRCISGEHPEHGARVQAVTPQGKFPLLVDGATEVFEATSIVEYLALVHPGAMPLLPADAYASAQVRMIDRVFDNYVMGPMQDVVQEYLRNHDAPDMTRVEPALARLERSYGWLEHWLQSYSPTAAITLVECAAAPSLFYADWVRPIGDAFPRLKAFRAHLLALPPVAQCVEEARPYRPFFPLGAPDRD
ncbi:MAG: hypothetical protein RIS94_1715 [Pseudomonadota bacterium]|jgi:glutathione S-transferase